MSSYPAAGTAVAALGGPWDYVASPSLPADFGRIPATSPAGVVLAAVAGTPQAQEAVIANSIPQTATVPRVNGPKFTPVFDGDPAAPGRSRARRSSTSSTSPTPVIRVDAGTYYSLQAGVWFYAISLSGPWYVAPAVPAVIYTIPVTSPLHYVTYVHGVRVDDAGGLCRLYARVPGHGGRAGRRGRVRHGVRLSAVDRHRHGILRRSPTA